MNSIDGISNFKVRDINSGECIAELQKTFTADEFRILLRSNQFDLAKKSIHILSKAYYKH